MAPLLLLAISGAVVVGAAALLRAAADRHATLDRVALAVGWPREVKPERIAAVLDVVAGLRPTSGLARWLHRPAVILEVESTEQGVAHRLIVARSLEQAIRSALQTHLDGMRIETVPLPALPAMAHAVRLALTDSQRPLTTSNPTAVSASLHAALRLASGQERTVTQIVITPAAPRPTQPAAEPARYSLLGVLLGRPTSPVSPKEWRDKHARPMVVADVRIGAVASSRQRARQLVGFCVAALAGISAPGVRLRPGLTPSALVARQLARRSLPLDYPLVLNTAEAAQLGWPLGSGLPGVEPVARPLRPSPAVPSEGRVIGLATYPGLTRPVALSERGSLEHTLVLGGTGSGKTALFENLIRASLAGGYATIVLDALGDLTNDVLRLPELAGQDVALLDPSDNQYPIGFNLLGGGNHALIVDQVVGVFSRVFARGWAFRSDDQFRAVLMLALLDPDATICDAPQLLTDAGSRRVLLARAKDTALLRYWQAFDQLSPGERGQWTAPLLNKLRQIVLRPEVRNVLGQPQPRLDLADHIARRGVLLIRLATGELGEAATELIGSLVISRIWQTVMGRTAVDRSQRHPIMLFIDEAHRFVGRLPVGFGDMTATARGHGLAVHAASQHLRQFGAVETDLLANCRNQIVFKLGAHDAHVMAREWAGVEAADLMALPRFEVAAQLSVGSTVAPPLTARTLPPPDLTGDAEAVRERSRRHYGRPRSEVEAWLRQRAEGGPDETPTSRKRRLP